jgi:hypothetical protein
VVIRSFSGLCAPLRMRSGETGCDNLLFASTSLSLPQLVAPAHTPLIYGVVLVVCAPITASPQCCTVLGKRIERH